MKEGKQRISEIDVMKGIAMILIIVAHSDYPLHPCLDILEVPAFFFLSGMLLRVNTGFVAFAKSKFVRIIVPYLFFSLFFALPYFIEHPIGTESAVKVFLEIFVWPANYPLWFMKSIFWCYLTMWVLIRLSEKTGHAIMVFTVLTLAIAIVDVMFLANRDWPWLLTVTGLPQAVVALPLMCMGWLSTRIGAFGFLDKMRTNARIAAAILVAASTATWLLARDAIHLHEGGIGEHSVTFYPAFLCAMIAFAALSVFLRWVEPLKFTGRHSLAIMGAHALFIYIGLEILLLPQWMVPLVALAGASVVAVLCRRYLPRLSGY